jgi:hypothetical protein
LKSPFFSKARLYFLSHQKGIGFASPPPLNEALFRYVGLAKERSGRKQPNARGEAPPLIAPDECWEDKAGLLCFAALGFLTPQLHKGTTTVLQTEDLGIKSALDKAAVCLDHFSEVRASKAHAKRGHLKSGSADRNRPSFKFIPTPDLEQPSLSQLKKRAL